MASSSPASHIASEPRAAVLPSAPTRGPVPSIELSVHATLDWIEADWRRFERIADCTVFQTFDWLATWHRHVGSRNGAVPAVVAGHCRDGDLLFILPLAIEHRHGLRSLCWLGQDLCDYNAPLLAPDFPDRVAPDVFLETWQEIRHLLQADSQLHHDWVELAKMPQMVGAQVNPFTYLDVTIDANGAHIARLRPTWDEFYALRRSTVTRRRDRSKRKRLANYGEIRFLTAGSREGVQGALEMLMRRKSKALARMGAPDIFERPGYRAFFFDMATNPATRSLVHVSQLTVGNTWVAGNLGLEFRDCYYHVLSSYDDGELARYGPGAIHLRELLRRAIECGFQRFDFTIGDEPYKQEWSDTTVSLYDYAAGATWRGELAGRWSAARGRLKRLVKQTPLLWSAVRHFRSAAGSLRSLRHRSDLSVAAGRAKMVGARGEAPAVLACVMGDMDLLRPVALAGIPCAVVTRPGVPSLYSRFARATLAWDDFSQDVEGLVDALVRFGVAQPERPVLFYEEDAQLLLISRHRQRLAQAFRFVIAEATLVEDLVDKARFQALAERLQLPVPPTRRFRASDAKPQDIDLRFPVIIKPVTRLERWNDTLGLRKALHVQSPDGLRALWPQLAAMELDLLAQELVAGPEAQIESYHVYVDECGRIAGEFTGRKIRTYPVSYGHSTALVITQVADVTQQGRDIVRRLGLRGVAKLDFKRGPSGELHLLEINPRFNLWHHPAAIAGVNLPALVYADLVGLPRPGASHAEVGVRWCRVWKDLPAARDSGVPLTTWLPWAWACEAKSSLAWDDSLPVARAALFRLLWRHLPTGRARRGRM